MALGEEKAEVETSEDTKAPSYRRWSCREQEMEETRLSASEELPQTLTVPRATALCSGHDADTEEDLSPVESPRVLDLSQQPHISGFPFPSRWRSGVSPGAAAPQFSSCSGSASSPGSSLQGHQEKAEPRSCSLAKVSSLELVVPQSAPSVGRPGPRLQWSPQPVFSGGDAPGLGRRRLSFQAEYWACVLPDSLPPSPDRHSPLWNPNKEYEDLLDYTYPLRPRPQLLKHLDSHVLADPVLQDSGSIPTVVTLPTGAPKGQSSLDVSDSDGPASLPSDSSQSQLPSRPARRGSRGPEGQNHCLLRSFVHARDSAVTGGLGSGQALGVSSGPLRTCSCLPAMLDRRAFSDPDADGQPPRRGGEQGKESLMQCVKTFCCQLEELIRWLYNVADVTNHLTPAKSNLTGLRSSLQLYRQFKKDIDEHQFLTESVLQKGEILLQCLLDNTPVLKDVLRRISKQPSELESHADHLYDTILASLDMLAGCNLIPDNMPVTHRSADVKGISLASSQAEM
ncbi:centrosomal protein of 68 kDa isoform X8 [Equus przewalskii]|uniref:Centrosomal protein of 68 kDa isoform X8 n=1 Tax=Equus przewalskii TaxID=9798 RepID=A0ABM4KK86_EQUPR